mmetsp:Transcript_7009/g.26968  ORF Transcript_7009/g.26968 Transcript_7009/m.26968 type:complete len:140 (-) Transcript_7009:201-620(-)|eukprot:scaffold1130_cov195-Pinguiococcus_pyrenoidosus.AAC.59
MQLRTFILYAFLFCVSAAFAPRSGLRLQRGLAAISPVTECDFNAHVLQRDKPVLVLFTASWCGPCSILAPVVHRVVSKYPERLECVSVTIDKCPELTVDCNVSVIPTTLLYRGGEVKERLIGTCTHKVLSRAIEKVLKE